MKKIFQHTAHLEPDQIRDYLSHNLSDDARYQLENHLLDCSLCADAVEGFEKVRDVDIDSSTSHINQRILDRVTTTEARIQPIANHRPRLMRIAAVALIFILSGAGLFYWQHTHSERLFAQHFHTYSSGAYSGMRAGNTTGVINETLLDALNQYEQGRYEEAKITFDAALSEEPQNAVAHFFAGVNILAHHDAQDAIPHLEFAFEHSSKHKADAAWYLSLAHLLLKNKEEARSYLDQLLELPSSVYTKQANEVLEELRTSLPSRSRQG